MTKEEIMKLAREAGPLISTPFDVWCERFANIVAAHKAEIITAEAYRCGYEAGVVEEREACALICTNIANRPSNVILGVAITCADAIRARGSK